VGKLKDGRGEIFDQEDFNGQNIFVRYLWTAPSAPAGTGFLCGWGQDMGDKQDHHLHASKGMQPTESSMHQVQTSRRFRTNFEIVPVQRVVTLLFYLDTPIRAAHHNCPPSPLRKNYPERLPMPERKREARHFAS
jgi:hypothetical protein